MRNSPKFQRVLTFGISRQETTLFQEALIDLQFVDGGINPEKLPSGLRCLIIENNTDSFEFLNNLYKSDKQNFGSLPVIIIGKNNRGDIINKESFTGREIEFIQRPYDIEKLKALLYQKVRHSNLLHNLNLAHQEVLFLQRKLNENEHRLKILSATVNEPIVFVDSNLQIKFWNKEAENIFGFSKFEVVSEDFLQCIIAPQSIQLVQGIFQTVSQPGSKVLSAQQTFFVRNKLGVVFETDATISVHSLGKGLNNFVFVFHDVQKVKKLEREIARNNELHEENKILREFIHTVSHDLRTPMNAILGIAKTLVKYNSANLTDKQREGLDIIYQCGSELMNLIRDLLDLVRMERGKLELNNEYFDVDKMLSLQKTQVLHLLGDKQIKFAIKKSHSIPPILIGDYRKIGQVLTNLLTNAVKYTEKGKIILSTHIIDNKFFFEISDTGYGISEDKLKVITNKFEQVNSAYTVNGIGLGLHISSKLILMMNGEISFESKPGKGTVVRFYIFLPEENKMSISQVLKTYENKDDYKIYNYVTGKKLFLVIDDSEKNEFIYSLIGDTKEYAVILAKNGKTGLKALSDFYPDVVLLKLEIPEIHGTFLIKEIQDINPHTPIFVITDYENLPISLPPEVIVLLQPITIENIMEIISTRRLSSTAKIHYKICIIYEELSRFEKIQANKTNKIFIQNRNTLLSFIQLNRLKIDYLVFEQAYGQNNTELIFKLIDDGCLELFKEIIILQDSQPMKYLKQKIENCDNVRLITTTDFKIEDFT